MCKEDLDEVENVMFFNCEWKAEGKIKGAKDIT